MHYVNNWYLNFNQYSSDQQPLKTGYFFTFDLMGWRFTVIYVPVCQVESGFASQFYGENTVSKWLYMVKIHILYIEFTCSVNVDRGIRHMLGWGQCWNKDRYVLNHPLGLIIELDAREPITPYTCMLRIMMSSAMEQKWGIHQVLAKQHA